MPKTKNVCEKPELGVDYDLVHVNGDEDAIVAYEDENTESCFLVDWKCEFEDLFHDVNSRLTDRKVETIQPPKGYKCCVQSAGKKKSLRSFDRFDVLKAMASVIKGGSEEMRVITESFQSDTIVVMVKPVKWWKALDKQFKSEMKSQYTKLK